VVDPRVASKGRKSAHAGVLAGPALELATLGSGIFRLTENKRGTFGAESREARRCPAHWSGLRDLRQFVERAAINTRRHGGRHEGLPDNNCPFAQWRLHHVGQSEYANVAVAAPKEIHNKIGAIGICCARTASIARPETTGVCFPSPHRVQYLGAAGGAWLIAKPSEPRST
jgi:hypothetical protein